MKRKRVVSAAWLVALMVSVAVNIGSLFWMGGVSWGDFSGEVWAGRFAVRHHREGFSGWRAGITRAVGSPEARWLVNTDLSVRHVGLHPSLTAPIWPVTAVAGWVLVRPYVPRERFARRGHVPTARVRRALLWCAMGLWMAAGVSGGAMVVSGWCKAWVNYPRGFDLCTLVLEGGRVEFMSLDRVSYEPQWEAEFRWTGERSWVAGFGLDDSPRVSRAGDWALPLWLPLVGLVWLARRCSEWARRGLMTCGRCGYSLEGLPAGAVCPECGRAGI